MSKQKHDLGRIKKASPKTRPAKPKSEKKKARAERIADAYARAEIRFQQLEQARRERDRQKQP